MAEFSLIGSILTEGGTVLGPISDIEIVEIGGFYYLYVAAESTSSLYSYSLNGGSLAAYVDSLTPPQVNGSLVISDIEITTHNGATLMVPAGRWDDAVALQVLNTTGHFGVEYPQVGGAVDFGNFHLSEAVAVNGKTYLFAAQWGQSGLRGYRILDDNNLEVRKTYTDDASVFLGDVAAMESLVIDGKAFLFVASAFDAGMQTYVVGPHGNLRLRGSAIAPDNGSGFSLPQALLPVTLAGQNYLILASAGSNSLTVYRVNKHGRLTETDHKIDTLLTRFEDASVLESFTISDRVFVLAAGSDDGITLFELLRDGSLLTVTSLADDFDTTLQNVSAIQTVVRGQVVDVFVSSGSEGGFTQFELDPGNLSGPIIGTPASETLTGGDGNDIIYGEGRRDFIFGGTGDDFLVDGRGKDYLTGGPGADTFRFIEDGRRDVITDYEVGIDVIDLSLISGIASFAEVQVLSRSYGAMLIVGGEMIRVNSIDGTRLLPSDFSSDDFIF